MQTEDTDSKPHEFRLGLVMYGGVSLAIYIYGTATEFYHAVRGNDEYKVLKELLNSDIVVDVISGASAGGVNAVLLGRALASGGDFEVCADLWRKKGDALTLLEHPLSLGFEGGSNVPRALFQSDRQYRDGLADALREIAASKPDAVRTTAGSMTPQESLPSRVESLDVFLTTTDIRGRRFDDQDDSGAMLKHKDHRALFHLKHRLDGKTIRKSAFVEKEEREEDELSDEDIVAGLAGICRATSAFPVAFRPVRYDPEKDKSRELDLAHVPLMKDTLRGRARDMPAWFSDGGILDNKPFTQAIESIYDRAADRPVERYLFFVEPDPERFSSPGSDEPQPEVIGVAALTAIPAYESIVDDLALVREHNRNVRLFRELELELESDSESKGSPTPRQGKLYDRARRAALTRWMEEQVEAAGRYVDPLVRNLLEAIAKSVIGSDTVSSLDAVVGKDLDFERALRWHFHTIYAIYETLANIEKLESKLWVALETVKKWTDEPAKKNIEDAVEKIRSTVVTATTAANDGLPEETKKELEENAETLSLDGNWLIRLVQQVSGWAPGPETSPAKPFAVIRSQLRSDLRNLFKGVKKLRIVKDIAEREFLKEVTPGSNRKPSPLDSALSGKEEEYAEMLRVRLESLLAGTDSSQLHYEALKKTLEDRLKKSSRPIPEGESNSVVLQICEATNAEGCLSKFGEARWNEFGAKDTWLYPLIAASGVRSRDTIELVRISPVDANSPLGYAKEWELAPQDRISGDAAFHFGGFLQHSWRSNDIFWGRCDGADRVIRTLLNSRRSQDLLTSSKMVAAVEKLKLTKEEIGNFKRLTDEKKKEQIANYFVLSAHRRIALKDVPAIAHDSKLDQGLPTSDDSRDKKADERLQKAKAGRTWRDVDREAKKYAGKIGKQGVKDVPFTKMGQILTRVILLLSRSVQGRLGPTWRSLVGIRLVHGLSMAAYLLFLSVTGRTQQTLQVLVGVTGSGFVVAAIMTMSSAVNGHASGLQWLLTAVLMILFGLCTSILRNSVSGRPLLNWVWILALVPLLVLLGINATGTDKMSVLWLVTGETSWSELPAVLGASWHPDSWDVSSAVSRFHNKDMGTSYWEGFERTIWWDFGFIVAYSLLAIALLAGRGAAANVRPFVWAIVAVLVVCDLVENFVALNLNGWGADCAKNLYVALVVLFSAKLAAVAALPVAVVVSLLSWGWRKFKKLIVLFWAKLAAVAALPVAVVVSLLSWGWRKFKKLRQKPRRKGGLLQRIRQSSKRGTGDNDGR